MRQSDANFYLREGLRSVKERREKRERELREVRAEGAELLREAVDEGISVSEAAKLLGISRVTAYELLKK